MTRSRGQSICEVLCFYEVATPLLNERDVEQMKNNFYLFPELGLTQPCAYSNFDSFTAYQVDATKTHW